MKKKLMATLLALALVLSLVPTVFASGSGDSATTCATCGCPSTCTECFTDGTAGTCPCKVGAEGTGHSCGASCKFQKCPEEGCTSKGSYVDSSNHTHTYTCVDATTEGVCKADSHNATCIEKCDKSTECAATGAHKSGCALAAKIEANTFTEKGVTFELDCDCALNHDASNNHIAEERPAAPAAHAANTPCTRKVTVKADVTYTVDPAGEEATDEEKATALAAAKEAKKTELNAGTNYCDVCRAAELSTCTMGVGCTSDVHKANCLTLCNRTNSCPNTSGDPTVHLTTYTVTKDGAALGGTYNSLAEAKAAIETDKNPPAPTAASGGESASPAPTATPAPAVYVITAHACPKANVADQVVLTVGGETVTDPAESEEPTAPVEVTKAEDFTDVEADDWFAADLTTVIEKGWLKGNGDGSFNPEGEVSGQEAVVFVSRMLGKDLVTSGADWAAEATKWAADEGLTEGIEITSEGIARKDLILLLWRAAGKQTSDHEINFSDVDELEGDYLTALKWAVENGIILGNDDGTATPHAATSRSEISVILVRYDKAVNK